MPTPNPNPKTSDAPQGEPRPYDVVHAELDSVKDDFDEAMKRVEADRLLKYQTDCEIKRAVGLKRVGQWPGVVPAPHVTDEALNRRFHGLHIRLAQLRKELARAAQVLEG